MKKELERIATAMQGYIDSYDTETAHGGADELLIESLTAAIRERWSKADIRRIVELYEKVDKWYA